MTKRLVKNYSPLDRLEKWDRETQNIIKQRINKEMGNDFVFCYLTAVEGEILSIVIGILIPQKLEDSYIKIAESIDKDLSEKKTGVRYGKDPWSGEFYRSGIMEISERAEKKYGKLIMNMENQELENLVTEIMQSERVDFLQRFLRRVLSDSIVIYFSHPASWTAVGFPGPAYPEGYAYLGCGEKEEWEPEF